MPSSIDLPKATIYCASYLLKWSDRSGDVGAVDREDCVAHSHLAAEGGRPPVGNGIDNNPSSGRAPLVFLPTEDHADADRLTSVLTLLHSHNLQLAHPRQGTPNHHHANSNFRNSPTDIEIFLVLIIVIDGIVAQMSRLGKRERDEENDKDFGEEVPKSTLSGRISSKDVGELPGNVVFGRGLRGVAKASSSSDEQ